jgi:hypothetical protein
MERTSTDAPTIGNCNTGCCLWREDAISRSFYAPFGASSLELSGYKHEPDSECKRTKRILHEFIEYAGSRTTILGHIEENGYSSACSKHESYPIDNAPDPSHASIPPPFMSISIVTKRGGETERNLAG